VSFYLAQCAVVSRCISRPFLLDLLPRIRIDVGGKGCLRLTKNEPHRPKKPSNYNTKMKIRKKFTVLGSLAVLATSPLVSADQVAVEPQVAICWESPVDFKEEPVIIVCPGFEGGALVSIDPVIIEENGEGALIEAEAFTQVETLVEEEEVTEVTDGVEELDPKVVGDGESVAVPLDWIKRGGGDHPEIYYSVTNFGGPEVASTTVSDGESSSVARQIGPDSKTTAIERGANPVLQANREKKGPVALVKEGRVFLR